MIESPLIQEIVADQMHKAILRVLQKRLGLVPSDIPIMLQPFQQEAEWVELLLLAASCPDLETFQEHLRANSNGNWKSCWEQP
jgi:hypothetical protein